MVLALAAGLGCAPKHPPAPPKPTPTVAIRPRPGYEARIDSLDRLDAGALAGRRIALDPGHGGFFRGSIGVGGLTEAAVNLDVARELAGLLERHGAIVTLTRTTDRDFLSPADSALRVDLAERTRIANAASPELFVSIHHNADAAGVHDRNETQTYFKLGDEGASLDAAQSLHRYLKRNLGIDGQRILPGNYFVLRNSEAPAALTEASFITNPDVEAKLALPEKRRLEAEALFLGIADFFARRRPEIVTFEARASDASPPDTAFEHIASPVLSARVAGEFDEWSLTLDGDPVAGTRIGDRLEWRPGSLTQGRHAATLDVRLSGEGAALERRLAFTIRRNPESLNTSTWPPARLPGVPMAVRVSAFDHFGMLCRDSLRVRVQIEHSAFDTSIVLRDGVAWAYLPPRGAPPRVQALRMRRVEYESILTSIRFPVPGEHDGSIGAGTLVRVIPARSSSIWAGFVREMPSGTPLRRVRGTEGPAPRLAWLNRDGFGWFDAVSSDRASAPSLPGYRAWTSVDAQAAPAFVAIAGGALHGRRIALDPDGGGADTSGMGPGGTRAAMVNLDVARMLRSMLEAAGAEVLIVRDRDEALPDVERVRRSEVFGAERYLRIARRAESPRFGFYFSSPGGKAWAERAAATFASLGLPAPSLGEDAQYPLQQTSCPALYASLRRIDDPRDEEAMHAPGALRAEAYSHYVALAREWAPAAAWPVDSLAVHDPDGRPIPGSFVTLGRALVLETDSLGWIRWARTEEGPLEARCDGANAARVLLDSDRGIVVTGPRGR